MANEEFVEEILALLLGAFGSV